MWYWVDTSYACGGIKVNDKNIIVYTAPIFMKFKGWHFDSLIDWWKKKGVIKTYAPLKGG